MGPFVCIAGNIGAGKSTLTKILATRLGWRALYEPVSANPYLEDFYNDMARWAFHSQVHFFTKRMEQYSVALRSNEPFIQDRSLSEDVDVFARNLYLQGAMSEREWQTYRELCGTLLLGLQPPNAYIYLKASVPTLLGRIAARGSEYERLMPEAYLVGLNDLYEEWANTHVLAGETFITINTDMLDPRAPEQVEALVTEIATVITTLTGGREEETKKWVQWVRDDPAK